MLGGRERRQGLRPGLGTARPAAADLPGGISSIKRALALGGGLNERFACHLTWHLALLRLAADDVHETVPSLGAGFVDEFGDNLGCRPLGPYGSHRLACIKGAGLNRAG